MAEAKVETAPKTKKTATAAKAVGEAKPATKKAAAAKPAAAKPAAAKSTAAKATSAKKPAAAAKKTVTPEQRYVMICEAAYYKAERRGFAPENEVQDWLDAEAEINRLLSM